MYIMVIGIIIINNYMIHTLLASSIAVPKQSTVTGEPQKKQKMHRPRLVANNLLLSRSEEWE